MSSTWNGLVQISKVGSDQELIIKHQPFDDVASEDIGFPLKIYENMLLGVEKIQMIYGANWFFDKSRPSGFAVDRALTSEGTEMLFMCRYMG